jgi:carbonic anhydrase
VLGQALLFPLYMSRISSLGTLLSLPTQIISSKDSVENSCENYRTIEWGKYSRSYHNLLSAQFTALLSNHRGFSYINNSIYHNNSKNSLNLENLVQQSLIHRPKIIWLPCMDERIQYLTASHHALSLGMPGCECLMSYTNKATMIDDIIDICKDSPSIQEIITTSHSDCGAVDYAIKKYDKAHIVSRITHKLKKRAALIDKEGEKYALHFTHLLENALQENNLNISVRTHHFQQQELHSQNLHNAFGAIINFNPLLNSAELEENLELPMFNIYAGGQKPTQILKNIELALRISAGENGFGNIYFNKENPFILFFTLNQNQSPDSIKFTQSIIKKLQEKDLPLEVVYTILETA